ncbi:LemA family protein [Mycoplasmatota bacterium]|nr:LemA family protein [Mycoplasmatota bacterium]
MGLYLTLGIIAFIVLLVSIYLIKTYNVFVHLRNQVRNSWSQIDVQLKRRFDMIPNLVETVKGYARHEKDIFSAFAEARNMYHHANQTGNVLDAAKAEQELVGALGRLLAVREEYPELKADKNFQSLMEELSDTEDKIAYSRQFYNDMVMKINNKIEMFPSNIVALMFAFKQEPFFSVEESERENIQVDFK